MAVTASSYAPRTGTLSSTIVQHQIGKTIGQFEPRVTLQSIEVTQEEATLFIAVQYLVRRTRQVQKVSVPVALGGA